MLLLLKWQLLALVPVRRFSCPPTYPAAMQMAIARKSFVHLDREQSGFVSKDAFVSAMVQQAVASGMPEEETSTLVKELEQEFRCVCSCARLRDGGRLGYQRTSALQLPT